MMDGNGMDGIGTLGSQFVRWLSLFIILWARTAESQQEAAPPDVDPAAAELITAAVDAYFNPSLPAFIPMGGMDAPPGLPPAMPPAMPPATAPVEPATANVPVPGSVPTGPPKEVPYKKSPPENAENLIAKYDEWQYLVGEHPTNRDFTKVGFTATNWKSAHVGIGFGGDDDVTVLNKKDLKTSTVVYLRHEFDFEQAPKEINSLGLVINFKDGFIAFLNGHEIARRMVSPTGVGKGVKKVNPHEATGYEYFQLADAKQYLLKGKNCLAIEGHLADIASDNLTVDPYFVVLKNAPKPGAKSASARQAGKKP
jgi:hypothetical protein